MTFKLDKTSIKTVFAKSALALSLVAATSQVNAEIYVNPIGQLPAGEKAWSVMFAPGSEVEYDFGGGDSDIERTYVAATGIYGLGDHLDLYGSFVPVFDIDNSDYEGDGLTLAFGARYGLSIAGFDIGTYAQFSMVSEEYELKSSGEQGSDINGYELITGALLKFGNQKANLYVGPEMVLLSELEIEDESRDIERDNGLGFRGGVNYAISPKFTLFADLAVLNEETLTLGVETRL